MGNSLNWRKTVWRLLRIAVKRPMPCEVCSRTSQVERPAVTDDPKGCYCPEQIAAAKPLPKRIKKPAGGRPFCSYQFRIETWSASPPPRHTSFGQSKTEPRTGPALARTRKITTHIILKARMAMIGDQLVRQGKGCYGPRNGSKVSHVRCPLLRLGLI